MYVVENGHLMMDFNTLTVLCLATITVKESQLYIRTI